MLQMNLAASKIDIGLLTAEFIEGNESDEIKFFKQKIISYI